GQAATALQLRRGNRIRRYPAWIGERGDRHLWAPEVELALPRCQPVPAGRRDHRAEALWVAVADRGANGEAGPGAVPAQVVIDEAVAERVVVAKLGDLVERHQMLHVAEVELDRVARPDRA